MVDPYGLEVFEVTDLVTPGIVDRRPDFYSLTISIPIPNPKTGSFIGWSGQMQYDKFGRFYHSPLGTAYGLQSFIPAISLTAGWLDECDNPKRDDLEKFLKGGSVSGGVGVGIGISSTYVPQVGTATEIGIFTPQIGGTQNYSYRHEPLDRR